MTDTQSPAPAQPQSPEPWLRGSKQEVPAVPRAVLHALELAGEDLHRWCHPLTNDELNSGPSGLPSVAFHLKHIAQSIDRLLTYAEARQLDARQLAELKAESDPAPSVESLFCELDAGLATTATRVLTLADSDLDQPRTVGNKLLPTTLGGLLIHVADHTQRHVGQAITTAKFIIANRA
jgi:uncharacterized damage-inducible protein DinB